MNRYNYLFERIEYPRERGYRMETAPLPDWMHVTISVENNSKVLRVHSRIHEKEVSEVGPTYSTNISDREILKDLSGEITHRYRG